MKRWFVLTQDAQMSDLDCYQVKDNSIIHHGKMSAESLQKHAGVEPIILVICAHLWSCVDVVLPKLKPGLLSKALPHMVEDAILSPADTLHCVLPADYTPEAPCTVLVISRDLMQGWKQWAQDHDFNLQAIIPAYTLLPIMQGHMGMMLYDQTLWLRYSLNQGYCAPLAMARILMDKLITHEQVDLFGDIDLDIKAKLTCIHPQMLRLQDCLLQAESFPINLLQGEFKPRKHRDKTKSRPYLLTAGLCATALMMHMIYLGVSHIVLSSRLSALKQESLALYQKAYPGALVVSSPKTLIARALGQGTSGENKFSEALSALTQATVLHPLHIQQIEYRDQQLVVMGSVKDFSQLEGLIQQLKEKGYRAEQQKAEQSEGKVEVSLLIARGST